MKDELANKLGYISKEKYDALQSVSRKNEYDAKHARASNEGYRNLNTKKITEAIRGTRMVRAVVYNSWHNVISDDLEIPVESEYKEIQPVRPEYTTLSVKIDIAGMRRINNDLEKFPLELDYFVGTFMRELENRIKVAMSMSDIL